MTSYRRKVILRWTLLETDIRKKEKTNMGKLADIAKKGSGKSTSEKKEKKAATKTRSDVPWAKIAKLYNEGKSTAEISDTLDLTRPKTQEGKENPYPYYLVVGYLTKLSHGVEVDGETIKIKRGSARKPKKEAA